MMVMGRPVKPEALKKKIGTARPDRARPSIAVLPATGAIPPAPKGLQKAGRAAWKRFWTLGSAWVSSTTDREILTRLCQAYDEREVLRGLVVKYGHLVAKVVEEEEVDTAVDAEKSIVRVYDIKANPAVIQLRKLEELITRYEGLCGFNPSDRSRLGLAEMQRVSKLDQFLQKQKAGS